MTNVIETIDLGLGKGVEKKPTLVIMSLVPKGGSSGTLNEFGSTMLTGGPSPLLVHKIGVCIHTSEARDMKKYEDKLPLYGFTSEGEEIHLSGDVWGCISVNDAQYQVLRSIASSHKGSRTPLIGVVRASQKINAYISGSGLSLYLALYDKELTDIKHII